MFDRNKEGLSISYIHYGAKAFDINKVKPISNRRYRSKPTGGLWASEAVAAYGWKDWCKENEYAECKDENSFKFILYDNANIIKINNQQQLKILPTVKTDFCSWVCPDFEKLVNEGVDAIDFVLSDDWDMYMLLYGWDCDSILIMNPKIIQEI